MLYVILGAYEKHQLFRTLEFLAVKAEAHRCRNRLGATQVVALAKDGKSFGLQNLSFYSLRPAGSLTAAFGGLPPFGESPGNLRALTCCHGDGYQPAATPKPGRAGQAPRWQVSSKSRFGFLMWRHLRSGKVRSFPWKGFSLHFISRFLTPKPQVFEH